MPSLKEKCHAIARDVGLPSEVFDASGAAAVLRAACQAMGIQPKPRRVEGGFAQTLVDGRRGPRRGSATAPPPKPAILLAPLALWPCLDLLT